MYFKNAAIQLGKKFLVRYPKTIYRFFEYSSEFVQFRKRAGKRFKINTSDAYPCLQDKLSFTPFDAHYTYHPAWAARKLMEIKPASHTDISSILSFSTIMSAVIPVTFYDYRPAKLALSNFKSSFADLKQLSFEDDSIESLSCMHTIEHIGLGRYGDDLDADGDLKAISELKRVLKKGGHLLFVTPVGRPRIEFNAHRIYSFEQITDYFSPLLLNDFSLVTDSGDFIENADPGLVQQQNYGCGCFWFTKTNI